MFWEKNKKEVTVAATVRATGGIVSGRPDPARKRKKWGGLGGLAGTFGCHLTPLSAPTPPKRPRGKGTHFPSV